MAESILSMLGSTVTAVREIVAIWHYVSDIMALLEILQLISAHCAFGGLALWAVSAIISGIIAEVFQSIIPTPISIMQKLDIL